jgi:hypothetical protein
MKRHPIKKSKKVLRRVLLLFGALAVLLPVSQLGVTHIFRASPGKILIVALFMVTMVVLVEIYNPERMELPSDTKNKGDET